MAAIANIVLSDALATPVVHTFVPKRVGDSSGNSSTAEWEDRVTGVYDGFWRIMSDISYPTKVRDTVRLRFKLSIPVMEVVTNASTTGIAPAPTISYTVLADMVFVIPKRSTLQVRKDLRKLAQNMLADTQLVAAIENIEAPF